VLTAQEEVGLRGAKAFDHDRLQAGMGYVFDHASPIGGMVLEAPSQYSIDARFIGREAHSGIAPEEGRSAIAAAARAIAEMRLGRIDDETTANVGRVRGGSARNIVAGQCTLSAEARYDVQNLSSVLGTVHTVSLAMSLVLMGVAVLTLITAGTGIMNIMFVNVAQRTHEIGIRKALGARTAEIRLQFVLEAAFISLSGAIIGVVIALGTVWFAVGLVEGAAPLSVSWSAVFFALLLSTSVGVLFGYRPANAAAQLNPVDALRVD
jgi:hypothetical protein